MLRRWLLVCCCCCLPRSPRWWPAQPARRGSHRRGQRASNGTPEQVARRVPRAHRQLHHLPQRAAVALGRRARHRHALRHGLRRQPHARRRHRPGRWSAAHFWRAMHHGRPSTAGCSTRPSRIPTSRITRRQRRDLFLPAQSRRRCGSRTGRTRWTSPTTRSSRWLLWRALFFSAPARPSRTRPQRGVEPRRLPGARPRPLRGLPRRAQPVRRHARGRHVAGRRPDPDAQLVCPALTAPDQAGVADWLLDDIVALLRDGISRSPHGAALGPMADVVYRSLQHLRRRPARHRGIPEGACRSRPPRRAAASRPTRRARKPAPSSTTNIAAIAMARTAKARAAPPAARLIARAGRQPAGPANMEPPVNLIRVIVHGGFAPATRGNPRPFGMPPFGLALSDEEIAALASHLRSS